MNQKTKKTTWIWLLVGAAVLAAVVLTLLLSGREPAVQPEVTTRPTVSEETLPPEPTEEPVYLEPGLSVETIDRYAGIYMEDGTDDIVQDVMMLLLHNETGRDLQLARIQVRYEDFTAEFEVTNLPDGERVVLLERNRHSAVEESWLLIESQNVIYFPEPMDLMPDRLELGGKAGVVEVTNISHEDLAGPVYVYYKNSAADLFYGGITYRVTIAQGLAAGETVRIPAGHYDPENCSFVMADCAG